MNQEVLNDSVDTTIITSYQPTLTTNLGTYENRKALIYQQTSPNVEQRIRSDVEMESEFVSNSSTLYTYK